VLPKRFGKYGLTLHPEKTRLIPFQRPRRRPDRQGPPSAQRPGTFDLLGFTHYWGLSARGSGGETPDGVEPLHTGGPDDRQCVGCIVIFP